MIKDVYLFTNGMLLSFGDDGQQVNGLQGRLTDELKQKVAEEFRDGTRITFARWKRGFFELTREEFMATEIENDTLILRFSLQTEGTAMLNENAVAR